MMGGNHAVSGAAVWLALTAPATVVSLIGFPLSVGLGGFGWTEIAVGAVVAAGAALLPDVDHHDATIAHSFPGGKILARLIGGAAGGHRKGTHSILGILILAALTIAASFLTIGGWHVGVAVVGMCVSAFALKVLRVVWFVRTWFLAWIGGYLFGWACAWLVDTAGGDTWWFNAAVITGVIVHVAGDMLTVGGVPPLYPWLPKPPLVMTNTPVLSKLWQPNGYMGVPILGRTGGPLEIILGVALGAYVIIVVSPGVLIAADQLLTQVQTLAGGNL